MKIKRTIAAIMALVLVGGAYPYTAKNNNKSIKAYAADTSENEVVKDGIKYTFSGSNAYVAGLADKTLKDIVIPAEVDGIKVTAVDRYAFKGTAIKSVVLGENITSVNSEAFQNCTSLTDVTFNDKLMHISDYAFANTKLKTADLSAKVRIIGGGAFADCKELTEVALNDNILRIDTDAFKNCENLTTVTGGRDLEYLGDTVFENCMSLSEINLGDKLTRIGTDAFSKTNLKELVVPTSVVNLYDCPVSLGFTVDKTGEYNEDSAVIIKNPNLKLSQRTSKDWERCLIVCDETSLAHDFAVENGLRYCTPEQYANGEYEKFTLSELDKDECIRKYGVTFKECEGGLEVASIDSLIDGAIIIPDEVGGIPVVKCDLGNPAIAATAFVTDAAFKAEKLVIGKNVKTIGDQCFVRCMNLKRIEGCEGVESIGDAAFANSPLIQSVSFGNKLRTIGTNAFIGCRFLETLDFPDTLESVGISAFAGCSGVKSINFGKSLKTIGTTAFAATNCTALEMPDSLETIGERAFCQCKSLKEVKLNEGLKTIAEGAFSECVNLRNINIPSTVTELQDSILYNTNISKLEIPKTVNKIGKSVFQFVEGNDSITENKEIEIWVYAPECEISEDAFLKFDVVYGYTGSTAETFVANSSYPERFRAIDGESNEPQFICENDTYKSREPFTITVKNVAPFNCNASTSINLRELDQEIDDDGNITYTFKAKTDGQAYVVIEYVDEEGYEKSKRFDFTILEEEYEDENSPKFICENDTYKSREPFAITVKNVAPFNCNVSTSINLRELDQEIDDDGNITYTFKAKTDGQAYVVIEYVDEEGYEKSKRFDFTILEEEYEDENSPKFICENDTYKSREPFAITVKNVAPFNCNVSTSINLRELDQEIDDDGNITYTFKAKTNGQAYVVIEYVDEEGYEKSKRFDFTILEEEYEDENSPKFICENDTYKSREPFTITVKNVAPFNCNVSTSINLRELDQEIDDDGNITYTFKAKTDGQAYVVIEYVDEEGYEKSKRFDFTILEEEYEDENSPKFICENDTYKSREPFAITVKNVAPFNCNVSTSINLRELDQEIDDDGNITYTFKAKTDGQAYVVIEYVDEEGYEKSKRFDFTILEEEYEDENSPKFICENDTYKSREPFAITVKNVAPFNCNVSTSINLRELDKEIDDDGNITYTFKAKTDGQAYVVIEYVDEEGYEKSKRFDFTILEEEYEDENSPKFICENDTYKSREPFAITVKNVAPFNCNVSTSINLRELDKEIDDDGNITYTFKAKTDGQAYVVIEYVDEEGYEKSKRFDFTILEEEYEDENSPKFICENDTYKSREPFAITVKNVAPFNCNVSTSINLRELDKEIDDDGNITYTFKAKTDGQAYVVIEYVDEEGYEKSKRFDFTILEEEDCDSVIGDANCDGGVDMSDIVLIMQSLANPNKYGVNGDSEFHITEQGIKNGDVDKNVNGITGSDALKIQRFLLGLEETL